LTDITYRPFRDSDAEQVKSLFSAAFGKPKDPDHWRWEFLTPEKRALIVVAESENKIVGHYAMLPRDYLAGGAVVRSALVVDVMTHPDFGRRGIFTGCGQAAFDLAKSNGIQMLVGFPNDAAIRGHLKVGWSELGRVPIFARPLDGAAISAVLSRRLPVPRAVKALLRTFVEALNRTTLRTGDGRATLEWIDGSRIEAIADELGSFIHLALSPYPVRLRRDVQWLKWRLADPDCPSKVLVARDGGSGPIIGYLVLKVKDREGFRSGAIIDLLTATQDEALARVLLREGLRESWKAKCTVAVALGSPCKMASIPFGSVLMFRTPRSLRFIVRDVGGTGLPDLARDLESWHLSFIDHDVF